MQIEGIREVGVAAAVVILILDRVFGFIKSQRNGKAHEVDSSGDKSPEYWQMIFKGMEDSIVARTDRIIDQKVIERLNDIKQSLMVLIKWRGGSGGD